MANQILQRNRHAQYVTERAICAGSLEKFATEMRGLHRTGVLEAEEPFSEDQTASPAMPHKRQPTLPPDQMSLSTSAAVAERRSAGAAALPPRRRTTRPAPRRYRAPGASPPDPIGPAGG
ncbi:MAG: hypothetical protein EXR51_06345 [Dehalococcoidia bacterium]|nr:hypothetical protein [Dehalococcoidia bacterium]